MKIKLATTNEGKVAEARKILAGYEVVQEAVEIPEIKSLDQLEVVKDKALKALEACGGPVVVEDTGIYFEAYPNFPGTYSKFTYMTLGLEGCLKLLEGKKGRKAFFKTLVAYADGSELKVFEGISKGTITEAIHKPVPFKLPFDSVFVPEGEDRTYSRMTKEEKAETSHRAKAFLALKEWLDEQTETRSKGTNEEKKETS